MNSTILFLVLTTVVLATCAPRAKTLDERSEHILVVRESPQFVKGQIPGVKGNPSTTPPHLSLRKGEYMCGDKVCKLRPGEIPKGCNGVCQYRIN